MEVLGSRPTRTGNVVKTGTGQNLLGRWEVPFFAFSLFTCLTSYLWAVEMG